MRFIVSKPRLMLVVRYYWDEATNCHCIVLPDIYLLGTVMLVFGMGLYELFVCNLDIAKTQSKEKATSTSNLFGLFALKVSKFFFSFIFLVLVMRIFYTTWLWDLINWWKKEKHLRKIWSYYMHVVACEYNFICTRNDQGGWK